jgi:two-component system, OmpR family, sensor histidine kinase KdpD
MSEGRRWAGYAWAVGATALSTLAGFAMTPRFDLVNVAMAYLLAVVVVALRFTRGPAVATSILCVAAFDFLFVPPRGTFTVDDAQYLFTFAIMLAVALVISALQESVRARERKQAALELETETERVRSALLASISHDLRTPLTAAGAGLGMLETSAADRLRIDEQQLLGNIRRNIARLSSLIDDLLAYNQLQAGALHLDRVLLDLRTVVADALPAVQPLIRTKGQILQVDLPLPLPHVGDTRRLGQVLINLLCNAHQHTPPGTHITITGHIDNGEICLVVCDDGPGIPECEREAIFERFYRLSAAGSGSGLGLAIARGLVELHSGRIWVEQTNERGSMFCIALPCAPSKEEP